LGCMQGLTVRRTHLGETKASGFRKPTVSGAEGPASALGGQQLRDLEGLPDRPAGAQPHYSSPTRSRLPSCKSFVFCAKMRETFLLGKAAGEWLPLAL
jgi:hypothetical protein